MSKFELSLTESYVGDWGVKEGLRELYQNAVDQEVADVSNEKELTYDAESKTLVIGNKNSVLEPKTLLLGETSKRDDDETIGQFGEGYKLALLVLTREGKKVNINNYGRKEVWDVKFVNSTRYGGAKILTIVTTKKKFWEKVPNNNLEMVIEGISEDEYESFKESVYNYEGLEKAELETVYGNILLDKEEEGKIYVNGLLVTETKGFKYGYNIKPKFLEIGRDRNLVNEYSISGITSSMWAVAEYDNGKKLELLKDEKQQDITKLDDFTLWDYKLDYETKEEVDKKKKEFLDSMYEEYRIEVLGASEDENALLLKTYTKNEWDVLEGYEGLKVEQVPKKVHDMLVKSEGYKKVSSDWTNVKVEKQPVEELYNLVEKELRYVDSGVKEKLNKLLSKLVDGYSDLKEGKATDVKDENNVPF